MKKEEVKSFSLYRHTSPSGKVYIGITNQPVEHRWNHGKGYMNCKKTPFKSTIIKYGWNNIKHEVLFTNLSEETAKHLEKELIRHYKGLKISLNVTDGGDGCWGAIPWNKGIKVPYEKSNKRRGCHLTNEHKNKLSIAHKGKRGHKWTEKQREILLPMLKGRLKGTHIPDERKERIKEHSAKAKKVIEFNTLGKIIRIFRSASEAGREYNLDVSWVAKACRNKVMCSGHIFKYENDIAKVEDIKPPHSRTGDVVTLTNIKTGESKVFKSKTACAKFLGYKFMSGLQKNINSGRCFKDDWKIAV